MSSSKIRDLPNRKEILKKWLEEIYEIEATESVSAQSLDDEGLDVPKSE